MKSLFLRPYFKSIFLNNNVPKNKFNAINNIDEKNPNKNNSNDNSPVWVNIIFAYVGNI